MRIFITVELKLILARKGGKVIYGLSGKNFAAILLLISVMFFAFMGSASGAETQILIFADNFDDYVVKTYSGSDGPGIWYQEVGGGGSATYSIVSSGGRTFYKLDSSDGVFTKAILPYYLFTAYIGPSDYSARAIMKVDKGEGGLIFRAQPVKIGTKYYIAKYYLATVYKTGKVTLWYVDEREGAGAGPKLAEAPVPDTVDLNDWFALSIVAKGNNIKVSVGDKEVINVNDDRLTYGSIGLYTFWTGTASFDYINWIAYIPSGAETTTTTLTTTQQVTTTVTASASAATSTITETVTTGTTLTTTVSGETTVTETETLPAETVTEAQATTVTATKKETVTSTVTETKISTATSTVTESKGLGCLIATAAFGSQLAPQVQVLRGFRDGFVLKTFAGRNFMTAFNAFYYSWSPSVAQAEYENPLLRSFVRASIYPLIYSLEVSRIIAQPFSAIPELAVLTSGIVASLFIGLIYVSPILAVVVLVSRWKNKRLPTLKKRYVLLALLFSLMMFLAAEALSISALMMIASALTVLSCMTIGAISLPTAIQRILDRRSS